MSLLLDRWCRENPSLAIIDMDLRFKGPHMANVGMFCALDKWDGLMLIEGPPESFLGVRWAVCEITNKDGIMTRSNCDYFDCIDDARRVYASRLADEIHFATYCR